MNKLKIILSSFIAAAACQVNAAQEIDSNFLGKWATSKQVCKTGISGYDTEGIIRIKKNTIEEEHIELDLKTKINKIIVSTPNKLSVSGQTHWDTEAGSGKEKSSYALYIKNGYLIDNNNKNFKYIKCY